MKKLFKYTTIFSLLVNANIYGQYSQSDIVKEFKIIPSEITENDSIMLVVDYIEVPGGWKPVARDTVFKDTVKITSYINTGVAGSYTDFIDTVNIGKLSSGDYVLVHDFFDLGKVLWFEDTTISFEVKCQSDCDTITKINLHEKNKININPNPTRNKINIQSDKIVHSISIFNNLGQLIETNKIFKKHAIIDFSEYNNGLYLIMFHLESDLKSYKVIKK